MIINIPNTVKKIFIFISVVVILGGSEVSPVFAHIPEMVLAGCFLLFIGYIVDRDTFKLTNNIGLMLIHIVIIGYLLLEYRFWALYPNTVQMYIIRYCYFFAFTVFHINCKNIQTIMKCMKWYAGAIAIVYLALYPLQGNNGSFLGSYQNVGSSMCIAMLIVEIDILLRKSRKRLDIVLFILYLGVLVMTGKRTFLIIPFVLLLIFSNIDNLVIPIKENRKRVVVLGVILLALGVLAFAIKPDLLSGINRFAESDTGDVTSGRDRLWGLALWLWKSAPFIGIGMGGYVNFIRNNTYITMSVMHVSLVTSVHNIYLQLLAENGIFGLIIYIIFFCFNIIIAISNLKESRHVDDMSVKYGAYFSLFLQIWFLLYGITGNPLFTLFQIYIYFFTIMIGQSVRCEIKRVKQNEVINNNTSI